MGILNTFYSCDMFEMHSRFVLLLIVDHFLTFVTIKEKTSEISDVALVKETAKLLRQELLNSPYLYPFWPPTEKEVLSAKYITAPLAEACLSTLLTSRGWRSSRLTRIICSLA